MEDNSATIAISYLHEEGNEQNKVWLTREHLQLLYKGKLKVFPLKNINRISFNHRKLMLPLVIGGIAASLSLVAIIKLFYNPWLTLSLLTAGCLAAYRGYQGSWVLTIEEAKFNSDFFIRSISPNLKAFVRYANTFTGHKPQGILYLPLSPAQWEKSQAAGFIKVNELKRVYFGFELSLIPSQHSVIIPIDSLHESIHIQWKKEDESGDIFPFLHPSSTVPLENIRPVYR